MRGMRRSLAGGAMLVQALTDAFEQPVYLPVDAVRFMENEYVVIHIDRDPIQRNSQRDCYDGGVAASLGIDEFYACEVEVQLGVAHLVHDATLMLPHG